MPALKQRGLVLPRRYACYLLFQLKTHNSFFDSDDDEGASQPALSLLAALGCLAGITVIVAVASECGPFFPAPAVVHLCMQTPWHA